MVSSNFAFSSGSSKLGLPSIPMMLIYISNINVYSNLMKVPLLNRINTQKLDEILKAIRSTCQYFDELFQITQGIIYL